MNEHNTFSARNAESGLSLATTDTPDWLSRAVLTASFSDRFIARLREIIEEHLSDQDFRAEDLAREAGMSRSQLHRKLTSFVGMTTTEFVRTYRLQRALKLLEEGCGNVTEVAYAVGFQSLSYFSRTFRQLYGSRPSDHLKRSSVDIRSQRESRS